MLANILMLKYDWLFATHFHVGVGIFVNMLLDDLCVFETTTTSKHNVQCLITTNLHVPLPMVVDDERTTKYHLTR